ncbi:WD40 repeat-like protein [Pluteus cervinus]|uniref:WD40 repeat-like protein n=1 Tax=Pluteus cervinus TaxID=181527 RepID=A0ACD3AZM7_9AGAR|nr:WD40 repeat-like protein [Pluteus cervinus]
MTSNNPSISTFNTVYGPPLPALFQTPIRSGGRPTTTVSGGVVAKRTRTYSLPSSSKSATLKRKRSSVASFDFTKELGDEEVALTGGDSWGVTDLPDRFVPKRPKMSIPLNVTPRTNRISRQFGLVDDRILSYKENDDPFSSASSLSSSSSSKDTSNVLGMLRRNASTLFQTPPPIKPVSVSENLSKAKQCVLTLDGPGISDDPFAYPISWSKKNLISVACHNEIFYQNLNTKKVSLLCRVDRHLGAPRVIEWGGAGNRNISGGSESGGGSSTGREYWLSCGTSNGSVLIWDAARDSSVNPLVWSTSNIDHDYSSVGGLSWYENLLAVGYHDGTIGLMDIRERCRGRNVMGHRSGNVLAVSWSVDGTYLASADVYGAVCVWDRRMGKTVNEVGTQGHKMRHCSSVKALAWCPWKPELLATGGCQPDGNINIWNATTNAPAPEPLSTISLNTSVLSLHWSPHCKELLSTHGSSFTIPKRSRHAPNASTSSTSSSGTQALTNGPAPNRQPFKQVSTPLTFAIAVHEYPTKKRLLTLKAHLGPITHSCLSPDGEKLFTVCPREETIKMWQVWGRPKKEERREGLFEKCAIR